MNMTQVRNATLIIEYAGQKLLIDPMLAKQGAYPGFPGTANAHLRNPLVDLPLSIDDILDVDAIIVTHTHPDHWDQAAVDLIAKDKLIFVQNEQDAVLLGSQGFINLQILSDHSVFAGISLIKTSGQHGSDELYAIPQMATRMGNVCGVVFKHPQEKTVYLAGDTIWGHQVEDHLQKYRPDVVILNAGFAQADGFGAIIMGKEDLLRTHNILPEAKIVATHMEAINHCVLSRQALKDYIVAQRLQTLASVPLDGETLTF